MVRHCAVGVVALAIAMSAGSVLRATERVLRVVQGETTVSGKAEISYGEHPTDIDAKIVW